MVLLYLFLLYFLLVFIGIRLIVPYYGFTPIKLPKKIPFSFLSIIEKIDKQSSSDMEYLKNCYEYLTTIYYGSRFEIFSKWKLAFADPFTQKNGFLPCNIFNFLLVVMLLKSGRFQSEEVNICVVFLNFFIHQYVKVKIDNTWICVDPTYKIYGVPFGKRAIGFV
jgi:hypothetical protein